MILDIEFYRAVCSGKKNMWISFLNEIGSGERIEIKEEDKVGEEIQKYIERHCGKDLWE